MGRIVLWVALLAAFGGPGCGFGVFGDPRRAVSPGEDGAPIGGDGRLTDELDTGGDSASSDAGGGGGDDASPLGDDSPPPTELLPPSQSPILTYCPFTDAADLDFFAGRPVVRVCPVGDGRTGCHTDSLAGAIAAASNGDRIEIVNTGTPYAECAVIPATLSNVEIIGVCGRPHLKDAVCESKGLLLNLGRDITVTNLEISNLSIPAGDGGNAAAIRDQSLGNLNVRYVYFHHNQNGILGGTGIVNIDWSRFEANGSAEHAGYAHNIYISSDVTQLNIRNSLFLRARYEGNNMKSRAQAMLFHCSVTASLDGLDSAEMDISEGGAVLITHSLIEQGPQSVNSRLLGFALEATDPTRRHATQSLVIRNTDMVNDRGNGTFIAYSAFNDATVELVDVRFVGSGTRLENTNGGVVTVTESGTTTLADRAAAGMPTYSTDPMLLPLPPGCSQFEYF